MDLLRWGEVDLEQNDVSRGLAVAAGLGCEQERRVHRARESGAASRGERRTSHTRGERSARPGGERSRAQRALERCLAEGSGYRAGYIKEEETESVGSGFYDYYFKFN